MGASSAAVASPQFYLGAQAGYQDTSLEVSIDWSDVAFPEYGGSSSEDYSVSGIAGGVFAGVKFNLGERFFISPEINLGTSNADGGITSRDYGPDYSYSESFEAEAGRSYGIGVLLGSEVTANTSVYGRLGYQRTKYELTYKESYVNNAFPEFSYSESTSDSDTFSGFRYGVGVETAVSERLALRLDWSQTRYSSKRYDVGDEWTNVTQSFKPTESLFQAGVVFTF